jgi:hypothetical protein
VFLWVMGEAAPVHPIEAFQARLRTLIGRISLRFEFQYSAYSSFAMADVRNGTC